MWNLWKSSSQNINTICTLTRQMGVVVWGGVILQTLGPEWKFLTSFASHVAENEWSVDTRAMLPLLLSPMPQPHCSQTSFPASRAHLRPPPWPRFGFWGRNHFWIQLRGCCAFSWSPRTALKAKHQRWKRKGRWEQCRSGRRSWRRRWRWWWQQWRRRWRRRQHWERG